MSSTPRSVRSSSNNSENSPSEGKKLNFINKINFSDKKIDRSIHSSDDSE